MHSSVYRVKFNASSSTSTSLILIRVSFHNPLNPPLKLAEAAASSPKKILATTSKL